jgi:ubiquinone biosynthesis monooxygenase Coq7
MNVPTRRIRDSLTANRIRFLSPPDDPVSRRALKKALRTLHNLEIMAVNIYKYQIHRQNDEYNRLLIAAMANEMTHVQDFHIQLLEYGFRPFLFRGAYWAVGMVIGFVSKSLGRRFSLRTGIWAEKKAVTHYGKLLESADWNAETKGIIEADREDEVHHIEQWMDLLDAGHTE